MSVLNTPRSYGAIARSFHWLTFVLIAMLIPSGIVANGMAHAIEAGDTSVVVADAIWLFSLHKTLGVTLFAVAILRILWALTQPKPSSLHPERRAETFLAEMVHWLLYGTLVLVPLSGWISHAASTGFAPIWWPLGQGLPLVPKSEAVKDIAGNLHIIFERVLVLSLLLHVAGALKHHFWDRDDTLRRMVSGTAAGAETEHAATFVPPLAAVVVFAVALGIGAGMGLFRVEAGAADTPALEAVASEWQVTEGEIAFSVLQFGSAVEGRFADWTAEISFDPDAPAGDAPVGSVTTTMSVASVTVGSVTSQALGADYFAADAHPAAVYTGDIFRGEDGYRADGILTLKGREQPVSFPFELTVDGNTAQLIATLSLQRTDFGIGEAVDEASLSLGVDVALSLTAQRQAE